MAPFTGTPFSSPRKRPMMSLPQYFLFDVVDLTINTEDIGNSYGDPIVLDNPSKTPSNGGSDDPIILDESVDDAEQEHLSSSDSTIDLTDDGQYLNSKYRGVDLTVLPPGQGPVHKSLIELIDVDEIEPQTLCDKGKWNEMKRPTTWKEEDMENFPKISPIVGKKRKREQQGESSGGESKPPPKLYDKNTAVDRDFKADALSDVRSISDQTYSDKNSITIQQQQPNLISEDNEVKSLQQDDPADVATPETGITSCESEENTSGDDGSVDHVSTHSSPDTDCPDSSFIRRQFQPYLSNTLWRSLCSAEPHNGTALLSHLATVHNMAPNSFLLKNMHDLIVHGPKSEGFRLVDPNKTELTVRSANTIMKQFSDTRAECSWDDFEKCLSLPIESRAKSLSAAAHSIEYVSSLLRRDISDLRKANPSDLVLSDDCWIVKTLSQCPGGMWKAMKCTVDWVVKTWVYYGSVVMDDSTSDSEYGMSAMRCLKALGKISCFVAWVYCEKNGTDLDDKDCTFLFRDSLLRELENHKKDNSSYSCDFHNRLKLTFILSLDEDFCMGLQQCLAKMLGIGSKWGAVTGLQM